MPVLYYDGKIHTCLLSNFKYIEYIKILGIWADELESIEQINEIAKYNDLSQIYVVGTNLNTMMLDLSKINFNIDLRAEQIANIESENDYELGSDESEEEYIDISIKNRDQFKHKVLVDHTSSIIDESSVLSVCCSIGNLYEYENMQNSIHIMRIEIDDDMNCNRVFDIDHLRITGSDPEYIGQLPQLLSRFHIRELTITKSELHYLPDDMKIEELNIIDHLGSEVIGDILILDHILQNGNIRYLTIWVEGNDRIVISKEAARNHNLIYFNSPTSFNYKSDLMAKIRKNVRDYKNSKLSLPK